MRGLELNGNLLTVGATFVREATTEPVYRLWSINDRYPAMLRVREGGVAIAVEVWAVPTASLGTICYKNQPDCASVKSVLVMVKSFWEF